jgi:hypothetical protein
MRRGGHVAKKLGPIELLWTNYVKMLRSQIRLKHAIKADRELNDRVPDQEVAFHKAVKAGKAKEFIVASITEVANEVA